MASDLKDKISTSALWNFPEIASAEELFIETQCEFGAEGGPNNDMSELEKKIAEIEFLKNTLLEKQQLLDQKISFINQLGYAIQNRSQVLDEEVIQLLEQITKKIIYKTIQFNIETNASLFKSIIFSLKEKMDQSSDLTVKLSKADSERIGNSINGMKIIIDENLKVGDICIESSTSQLNNLLLDRIDELMRGQHHAE